MSAIEEAGNQAVSTAAPLRRCRDEN
jgi:hypothetical protein